jgi:hypothetical protein
MSLENLFRGTEAQLYKRHPNGRFNALVVEVSLTTSQQSGRQSLVISLATSEGKTPDFRVTLFSESDALKAEHDPAYREGLIRSVQINKGVLVKLDLVKEDVIKNYSQDDMVKAYASLKGRSVEIVIEDDKKDGRYQRVTIEKVNVTSDKKDNLANTLSNISKVPEYNLDDLPF